MTVRKDPLAHCSTFTTTGGVLNPITLQYEPIRVRLPFGLPAIVGEDPFVVSGQVQNVLSAFSPVFQLADCALKALTLIKAIATLNPVDIANALPAIAECFGVTIPGMIPSSPTAIIDFTKLAKDLLGLLIALLKALQAKYAALAEAKLVQVNLEASAQASGDVLLQGQAQCLKQQNLAVEASINAKLEGIANIVTLLNLLLTVMGQSPIDPGQFQPAAIQAIIDILQVAYNAIPNLP